MTRLKNLYNKEIKSSLKTKLGLKNDMAVPKLQKISHGTTKIPQATGWISDHHSNDYQQSSRIRPQGHREGAVEVPGLLIKLLSKALVLFV